MEGENCAIRTFCAEPEDLRDVGRRTGTSRCDLCGGLLLGLVALRRESLAQGAMSHNVIQSGPQWGERGMQEEPIVREVERRVGWCPRHELNVRPAV